MLFLIEYSRKASMIEKMQVFPDELLASVNELRLKLELHNRDRGVEHEVVVLEADSEHALRITHQRYFEDATAIAGSMPRG